MSLLDEALRAPNCLISVMGEHAGEDAAAIFSRKIRDCREIGRTFWVAKSAKARPAQVRALLRLFARLCDLRRTCHPWRRTPHQRIRLGDCVFA